MMQSFREVPIRRKLRVVILAVCSTALIVACGVLFALQYYLFRRDFKRDLEAVTGIVASNSTAALAFQDADAANEILAALKVKSHILGAAIVLENGATLAEIGDPARPLSLSPPQEWGWQESGREIFFAQPILMDGQRLGYLLLHPDFRSRMNELFRLFASLLAGVLLISFVIAALVAWRLERLILDPLQALADVSRTIAGRHDYSVRAEKLVDDELGTFTDSFNSMLAKIEQRDQDLLYEIAERKRAEEALQSVHDQLLDASRRAGMAEVATGVLHNVGNVLNSVNVSATLLAEKLGHVRLEKLLRATDLLRQQSSDLPAFLTNDERGRLLPGYLAEISTQLATDRQEALAEIDLLMRNIEHIKDIVAMQQTYARGGGLIEPLSLAELLDDALRLSAASFEQHGVSVRREYTPTRPVAVDKHKVLQIFLNIMRNAKYAMDEADGVEKKLTVALREKAGAMAEVRLTDQGIGIPPESLTRIFSHGFTTRKDGHGFGLHSAALAAQQMGGRLSAESGGLGHGATFVLELPLATAWTPALAIPS